MALDRGALDRAVDRIGETLIDLSRKIHENPELCFEEHRAAAWIAEYVEQTAGVQVERGLGGLATALRARAGKGATARVAILAEYDALPSIGHACGHNLIAGAAVGAFVALSSQAEALGGTVELVGTPAEEGGGGKIKLLEAGVFEGVSAAMMFHPFDRDLLSHSALSSTRIAFEFHGAPSHAAIDPSEGRSALTAVLDTFRLIDGQRVHFKDGVRVHGIVTNGGQAVNIIVEDAACEFSVRAKTTAEVERVKAIVVRCARAAALASDVELEITERRGYREMKNNMAIAQRFGAALEALGRRPRVADERVGAGSTDMGDVSQFVPSIHPWLGICDEGETSCHQHEFAACAASPRGFETMMVAAKAMARTAADLLEDAGLLERARAEFAG